MKFLGNEDGDIIILFAMVLILIILFLGLSTDIIMAYNRRDRLEEIVNIMMESRSDLGHELWNSYQPERTFRNIVLEIGRLNDIKPEQIKVIWNERPISRTRRKAILTIELKDEYKCSVLPIFGVKRLPISVKLVKDQYKFDEAGVWSPYI